MTASHWTSARACRVFRMAADKDGIAAVEFALLLPMMTMMFFGMLEASDLFTVNRRLANATNSLVDLAAQEPTITEAELDDMIIGVTRILEPTDTSAVTMKVVSITKGSDEAAAPVVHWSRDEDGAIPYLVGSTFTKLSDNTTLKANSSLIVVEIGYHYDSGLAGHVISIPFDFAHQSARWPRKSVKVQLCATSDPATCTS